MGDLVVFGSCDGTFYALDKKTGRPEWSYDTRRDASETAFHDDPRLVGDSIVVGTDSPKGKGHLYAFERSTGEVRWKLELGPDPNGSGGVRAELASDGDMVFVPAEEGRLVAVRLDDGIVRWSFPLADPMGPAAADGRVYVGGDGDAVFALEVGTGALVWKTSLGAPISSSLILSGEDLIVGARDGHLFHLRRLNGEVASRQKLDGAPILDPILSGEAVLVLTSKIGDPKMAERLVRIDDPLAGPAWSQTSPAEWWGQHPALWRGFLLLGDIHGEVSARRASDGSEACSFKVDGMVRTIGADESTLYVGTTTGRVHAFEAGRQACLD